jgi:CRISPR-associated protein Csx10
MKCLKITLTQKSPVCFSNIRHRQNIFYTHDYIPGSVLWGFFINQYVKAEKNIHPDFFNDNIRFLNCYIKIKVDKYYIQTLPMPLSLYTCKEKPYMADGDKNDSHDLVDILFNEETVCRSKDCESKLHPVAPGYFYSFETSDIYRPRKIVEMHNKIDKYSQNTKADSLYSYELLDEVGIRFVGQILVEHQSDLFTFVKGFNDKNLRLGKARTSGCGCFKLNIQESDDTGIDDYFAEGFNDQINIYLHSDAIVMDALNCYQTVISPEILGLENEIRREKYFARSIEVQGFNAKHQKTRINDIAIKKGSCFSYRLEPGADPEKVKTRIQEIENDGLGIRKNEGFGRVRFNRIEFKED